MNKFLLAMSFLIIGVSLSACSNTVDGAGRDIEKAGEKIQETF